MITMTALQKFFLTISVLLVLGVGAYFWANRAQAPVAPGSETATTTEQSTGATSTPNSLQGGTGVKLVTPDYRKPITFSADIAADIRVQLNEQLKIVQAQLDDDPLDIKSWVALGTLYKIGGDYAAAAKYWGFLADSFTGDVVPYYSLGDLYENFLHNTSKAEYYYTKAIEAVPNNVNAYASLYTMYHYTLHDDTKAAAILQQGLAANPSNNYLLGLQGELQQ